PLAERLGAPAVEHHRWAGRLPRQAEVGERAVRLPEPLGVPEEVVVPPEAGLPRPPVARVLPRAIDEASAAGHPGYPPLPPTPPDAPEPRPGAASPPSRPGAGPTPRPPARPAPRPFRPSSRPGRGSGTGVPGRARVRPASARGTRRRRNSPHRKRGGQGRRSA